MSKEVEEKPAYKNAQEEIAAIELSIKKAQLEDIELQKQERALNIQETRARIGDRQNIQLQKQLDTSGRGKTLAQQKLADETRWAACTHKKGGMVSARNMSALSTGGNAAQYAVIKHQMINGDFWIRCLRCGKTWSPPVKDNYYFDAKGRQVAPKDGKFDEEKFKNAQVEYARAVNFETNNSPSGSVQCRFSKWDEKSGQWVDASVDYREAIRTTNLR